MDFDKVSIYFNINLQWFAKDGPGGEKTEPATAKKLREARDEGKVAKSKELTSAFDLIVLFLVLKIFISFVGERLINQFSYIYKKMPDFAIPFVLRQDLTALESIRLRVQDLFLSGCLPNSEHPVLLKVPQYANE